MNEPRPSAEALASAVVRAAGPGGGASVLPKLRAGMGKLVGSHGIDALLLRALRLAQKSEPRLAAASFDPAGSLQGVTASDDDAPYIALLSHVLELLIRFIGEDLAGRVIADIWPAVAPRETKR